MWLKGMMKIHRTKPRINMSERVCMLPTRHIFPVFLYHIILFILRCLYESKNPLSNFEQMEGSLLCDAFLPLLCEEKSLSMEKQRFRISHVSAEVNEKCLERAPHEIFCTTLAKETSKKNLSSLSFS